ncbi:MAG TPA: hypothetical protein VMB50_19550 [Myxococcales bacterium]|nr:hypothetical protein [Myxococcales bacterium]
MLAAFMLLALVSPPSSIGLPGGQPIGMDYVACDRAHHRVWVPAGNTGNVDVVDTPTGKVTAIGGFPTRPSGRPGRPPMGPSSVAVAGGVIWVGNRGDDRVCAFDAVTLARKTCVALRAMPDGIAWVGATRELWVTTPRLHALAVVGADGGVATIPVDGSPEGFAVDDAAGRFYTNLKDKNRTLVFDVRSRRLVATWPSHCSQEGPRGLAIDPARHLLFVACTSGALELDTVTGQPIGAPEGGRASLHACGWVGTGTGVDNLEYLREGGLLYVANGRDGGGLTVARVRDDDYRCLDVLGSTVTAPGARNPAVDANGTAYLPDPEEGKLLVIPPSW